MNSFASKSNGKIDHNHVNDDCLFYIFPERKNFYLGKKIMTYLPGEEWMKV